MSEKLEDVIHEAVKESLTSLDLLRPPTSSLISRNGPVDPRPQIVNEVTRRIMCDVAAHMAGDQDGVVADAARELVKAMCTDCPAQDKCVGWGVCHRLPVVGRWMVKLRMKVEEES